MLKRDPGRSASQGWNAKPKLFLPISHPSPTLSPASLTPTPYVSEGPAEYGAVEETECGGIKSRLLLVQYAYG